MPGAGSLGPPVRLSDGVVTLRPPRTSDIDDITAACQDPQVARWTTVPQPYTRADAEQYLAERPDDWWRNPLWAITEVPADRWSGAIDLRPDGHGGAEVGYLVAGWSRGHGHAARALRLACAFAFDSLDVTVVTWTAYVGNDASRRTARRVGFDIPEHRFRQWGVQRGRRRDSWLGVLTAEDLRRAGRQADEDRAHPRPALTPRERQVLDCLADGAANSDIAVRLGISENTVKNHVRAVLEKLPARSRSEAVVVGLRLGLTSIGR